MLNETVDTTDGGRSIESITMLLYTIIPLIFELSTVAVETMAYNLHINS